MTSDRYEAPTVIESFSTDDLVHDAAAAVRYLSDAALKDDVAVIDGPLDGLSSINTTH